MNFFPVRMILNSVASENFRIVLILVNSSIDLDLNSILQVNYSDEELGLIDYLLNEK